MAQPLPRTIVFPGKTIVYVEGQMTRAEELRLERFEENEKRKKEELKQYFLKYHEEQEEKAKSIDHVKEELKDRTCPNCENVISEYEYQSPECVYECEYCEKRICSSCQSEDDSGDTCATCWERICKEKANE
jgi:hypothetical protein